MTDTTSPEPEHPVEHAVVAKYQLTGGGFGPDDERAMIYQTQQALREAISQADVGDFDGNEFGAGTVTLYGYGPDADALFVVMSDTLRKLPLRPAHVILRYGSAADPDVIEHHIDL